MNAAAPRERVFLFLQGPHGPFFNRLGKMLRLAGAQVWRVGFNAGDRAFWFHPRSYIPFRGTADTWKDTFVALLADKGVTDIVLYGDTRPIHAQAVAEAVKEADRSGKWGSVGGEMRGKIREMVSKEVDWRSILKQFVGFSRRGTRSTTWNRVNTTMIHPEHGPLATASQRGYTSSIAVYIDQSGSVGNSALALAFAELRTLARHTEFVTYHFDTKVDLKSETVWKKSKTPKAHRTRCGGTCFECVTEHANKNKGRFDGYILISDGEAAKPKPSKLKRLYLLVPGSKLLFEPDNNDSVCKMKQPKVTS